MVLAFFEKLIKVHPEVADNLFLVRAVAVDDEEDVNATLPTGFSSKPEMPKKYFHPHEYVAGKEHLILLHRLLLQQYRYHQSGICIVGSPSPLSSIMHQVFCKIILFCLICYCPVDYSSASGQVPAKELL